MELRELQLYELNILKEFARVCDLNNLTYYLACGTLLGAVRHKGFIPWDDDIDVYMPMEDYMKFEAACKKSLHEDYYFQSRDITCENFISWNRIGVKNSTSIDLGLSQIHMQWGICIDIFPLFPYSDDSKEQETRWKWYHRLQLLTLKYLHLKTAHEAKGILKIKKLMHGLIPDALNINLFHYYLHKLSKPCKKSTKQYLIDYEINDKNKLMEKSLFNRRILCPFEDAQFYIPEGYDTILTTCYGDYMQVPDEKNRGKHSDNPNVFISFTEPYQKYWR